MKNKKLKIEDLKVKSFITGNLEENGQTIKGGYVTYGCTEGWAGCNGGGGGGGGSYNSCNPNPWYTHRPCDTGAGNIHCEPCK